MQLACLSKPQNSRALVYHKCLLFTFCFNGDILYSAVLRWLCILFPCFSFSLFACRSLQLCNKGRVAITNIKWRTATVDLDTHLDSCHCLVIVCFLPLLTSVPREGCASWLFLSWVTSSGPISTSSTWLYAHSCDCNICSDLFRNHEVCIMQRNLIRGPNVSI